ncbi:hypothetical protein LINPERPRIM_LOCUS17140 [Linum perenne]
MATVSSLEGSVAIVANEFQVGGTADAIVSPAAPVAGSAVDPPVDTTIADAVQSEEVAGVETIPTVDAVIIEEIPAAVDEGEVLVEGTNNEDAGDFAPDAEVDAEFQADPFHDEDPAVQSTEEDLTEARERAELSLLARIFWEEPRELRVVENSFLLVWRCGRVRIFDVGSGLYQFVFPSVIKRNWVLENQPWFFQRSIIHFTDAMTPSEDLFHSLQFMPIWVKIIGVPFSSLTIAVGRKLLAKLGEVIKVGYFDAGTPEGSYVKGRVRKNLLGSFLGTATVFRPNGTSFPAFFQYIGVPCICYLCGLLGHVMADCSPRIWCLMNTFEVTGFVAKLLRMKRKVKGHRSNLYLLSSRQTQEHGVNCLPRLLLGFPRT